MITFKDLPNTETPVTAENLNSNFNELDIKIGSIIESGSNANGNYVKYSDGTMICYNRVNVGNIPITNQTGNLYISDNLESFGDFPKSFISLPSISIGSESDDNTRYFWVIKSNRQTGGRFRGFRLVSPISVTLSNAVVSYTAIGRWK